MFGRPDFFTKLDIFHFNYSEDQGYINSYIVGWDITNNKERYISNLFMNPNSQVSVDFFRELICNNLDSITSKTLILDIRLLTDKVIDVLKEAYDNGVIYGIRLLPDNSILNRDIYNKLNSINGLLVSVDGIDKDIDISDSNLDLRIQNNLCKIERIKYSDKDNTNIHINRKLDEEEIKELIELINKNSYNQIFLDYYDPSYYKKFLELLSKNNCPKDINIRLLGNPLYDSINCFDFDSIISNNVIINYNTCNDLNEWFSKEPYTEAVRYYSDIEASGYTDSNNYYEMLKIIEEVVKHMEDMKYSPLEKLAYLEDYFKDNFIYDPDYETTDHSLNAHLDKVYKKDRMVCEGFSNLYSAILRRSGELCFTYGTDNHQKNIVRVKDKKYGVDNIALIDTTFDLGTMKFGNEFGNFLVPIDNDIYAQVPEVINIPTALVISDKDYDENIMNSNPVYATDPIGYAIRMLQLMGLSHGNRQFNTSEEEIDFYKSALHNSGLMEEIPYERIVNAIMEVRRKENRYNNDDEEWEDFNLTSINIQERGNDHSFDPAIKMMDTGEMKIVNLYDNKNDYRFVEVVPQNEKYHKPREKDVFESDEDYNKYLVKFYRELFHPEENIIDLEIDEYEFDGLNVDEVIIYRDINDSGRVYAGEEVFKRFNIKKPRYVTMLGNKKLYELLVSDAINILNNANQDTNPYIINYQYLNIKEIDRIKTSLVIFRDSKRPNLLYIRKMDYEKYGFTFDIEEINISGLPCCCIDQGDLTYIIGKSNDNLFDIVYKDVEINVNNMEPVYNDEVKDEITIYKNSDGKLYIMKEVFDKYHFNTDAKEIDFDDIKLYEINEDNYAYIIRGASNRYNPYRVTITNIDINIVEEIPVEDLIPGTNYRKPRVRGPYETDEEYVQYLEEYYNSIFGEEENKNNLHL